MPTPQDWVIYLLEVPYLIQFQINATDQNSFMILYESILEMI
ncbi:MAG: hypothetical protein V7L02_28650 [Nostoc sp.]